MNTSETRHKIDCCLDRLSSKQLQLVADLLTYLADKDDDDATQELLDIPEFLASFERGQRDIAAGRLVDWRTVRSDA